MRKRDDPRYPAALEAGWAILQKTYGIVDNDEVVCASERELREGPDLWAIDKSVAIVIGALREDVLLRYLPHFKEIVHLPFSVDMSAGDPTHFRCFKANRARLFEKPPARKGNIHYRQNYVIWGDSLIHGRSQRGTE